MVQACPKVGTRDLPENPAYSYSGMRSMERTPSYRHTRSVTPSATGLRLCLGCALIFACLFPSRSYYKLRTKFVFRKSLCLEAHCLESNAIPCAYYMILLVTLVYLFFILGK